MSYDQAGCLSQDPAERPSWVQVESLSGGLAEDIPIYVLWDKTECSRPRTKQKICPATKLDDLPVAQPDVCPVIRLDVYPLAQPKCCLVLSRMFVRWPSRIFVLRPSRMFVPRATCTAPGCWQTGRGDARRPEDSTRSGPGTSPTRTSPASPAIWPSLRSPSTRSL